MEKPVDQNTAFRAGINNWLITGDTTSAITWPEMGCYARIMALTVLAENPTPEDIAVRWAINILNGGILVPAVAGQSATPGAASMTPGPVIFLGSVNASEDSNIGGSPPAGTSYNFGLPPDLWINPSERLTITIECRAGPTTASLTQAMMRFYVPPQ